MKRRGKEVEIPAINQWVADAIKFANISGAELAKELHARKLINTPDRSIPSKMAIGKRKVSFSEALAIAEITGYKPPIPQPEAPEAPLAGRVGAGGSIQDVDDDRSPEFPRISVLAGEPWAAATIAGDSLGLFEGWYAVIGRRDSFHDGLYGHLCVVGTAEGETLIKWVEKSQGRGVTLRSGDGSVHAESVELSWAAKVIGLRPKQ